MRDIWTDERREVERREVGEAGNTSLDQKNDGKQNDGVSFVSVDKKKNNNNKTKFPFR